MADLATDSAPNWQLCFGSDISNYYPNRGLKVFKPRAEFLAGIVNFRDPMIFAGLRIPMVHIGHVRYASTNRRFQQVAGVAVSVTPTDLLGQKTALFGMTRTGNPTPRKLFSRRFSRFDGLRRMLSESASLCSIRMVNTRTKIPKMQIRRVRIQMRSRTCGNALPLKSGTNFQKDVITYGITNHPNDPGRILMLLNFYQDQNLQTGKEIINVRWLRDQVVAFTFPISWM